jgi:predicted AlkP superfamily pyrophosphatase or phosphodiesterase
VFFLYLTEIDARQHAHGSRGAPVEERLATYRPRIDALLSALEARGEVALTVCSDHGMTDITRVFDPAPFLEASGLKFPRDGRLFVDSTFLRFWPASPEAGVRIRSTFRRLDWGHLLEADEIRTEGVDFDDDRYGALLVLAEPGVLICPSFMGRSPLKGMHGYSPDDPASDAVLLRAGPDPDPPGSILDLRRLFLRELDERVNARARGGAA